MRLETQELNMIPLEIRAIWLLALLSSPVAAAGEARRDGSLDAAIAAAQAETRLEPVWQIGTPFEGVAAGWQAANRSQGLRTYFLEDGVRVVPRVGAGWKLAMRLDALARGTARVEIGCVAPEVRGERIEYPREGLVEWYVNRAEGLEQGFDLEARPCADGVGSLEIDLALEGDLSIAGFDPRGFGLALANDGHGEHVLSIAGLRAWDAQGRDLACHFARSQQGVTIVVEDREAVYPITVDPMVASEIAQLVPTIPPARAEFGDSLDADGERVIIGARSATGVAYIFREVSGTWGLEAKLVPTYPTGLGSRFGDSVAIRGTSAAVGAPGDDEGQNSAGAVYTFTFDGVRWDFEQKLIGSHFEGQLGSAVELTGNTLLAGAPREDHGGLVNSGGVQVYRRQSGVWVHVQTLLADSTQPGALFGTSLDVSDDDPYDPGPYLAIGAPLEETGSGPGAIYLYQPFSGFWIQESVLRPGHASQGMGWSVAYAWPYVLCGAPDANVVSLFSAPGAPGNPWPELETIIGTGGDFGAALDIRRELGDEYRLAIGAPRLVNGGNEVGRVWVWRFGIALEAQGVIDPPASVPGARFGNALAVTDDGVLVGARADQVSGFRSGTVRLFQRSPGGDWDEQASFQGTDFDAGDGLGSSVALHGDVAVVGASGDDDTLPDGGAAHVFERSSGIWEHVVRVTSGEPGRDGLFGSSVATDGETIVVGAPFELDGTLVSGAAYVFRRQLGLTWSQVQRLEPAVANALSAFGTSVAVEGDLIVVGAVGAAGVDLETGFAHVFRENLGLWFEEQLLLDSAGATGDQFGLSVALAGDDLFVSSRRDGVEAEEGVVFQYRQGPGGLWDIVDTLHSSDPAFRRFGESLSVDGDRLAIGSPLGASGAVQLMRRMGGSWQHTELVPGDPAAGPLGYSVALAGDRLAVATDGHAYLFQKSAGQWERTELVPSSGSFGPTPQVASSGETVLVGDPSRDDAGESSGLALLFEPPPPGDPGRFFDRGPQLLGFGDGSFGACPCGNESPRGAREGCLNSTGAGARLRQPGPAGSSMDDLALRASQIPTGQPVQLFLGEGRPSGLPFGDGLSLAIVPSVRFPLRVASMAGTVSWSDLQVKGLWRTGGTCYLQALYRDPAGPCGSGFNVTGALQLSREP